MSFLGKVTQNAVGVINYISNGKASDSTLGWATYAESDSVTFTDAGDLVTLNSHGLSNGNQISFTSITSTTGVSINTLYYVVSATTNTFQVASTLNGSALPLTTNGSGTMVRFVPKLGTGGSPSVTFSRSTTTPLRQGADYNIVKDASNRMGQGVSYDFTIDRADQGKVLNISFDYELVTATGTYSTADLTVYLIQDPTGTPVVVQPAGYQIQSASSGTKMKHIGTFQTSSSVTSYRLCVHVSSVSATAYTLALDNVIVGPQVVQYGAPVTDWVAYTPTFSGMTAVTAIDMQWRRVGDHLQIRGKFTSGGVQPSEFRMSLPSGLVAAGTDKIPTIQYIGDMRWNTATNIGCVLAEPSVAYTTFGLQGTSANPLVKLNGNGLSAGLVYSLMCSLPIAGWSSSVVMSNDTDTRIVDFVGYVNTSTALTANVTAIPLTTVKDTHGAWSTNQYTVPVSGDYVFSCQFIKTDASTAAAFLYVNGVQRTLISRATSTSVYIGSTLVPSLVAGDVLTFRTDLTTTTTANSQLYTTIHRLSGPSTIAASESVTASYWLSANQAVTTGVTTINFDSKEFDSHGAVTTGASWSFVAPISGTYSVAVTATSNNAPGSFYINKNGSLLKYVSIVPVAGSAGFGNVLIKLVSGDSIGIRTNFAGTLYGGALNILPCQIHIHRIGN
jgi:hypothetical protein